MITTDLARVGISILGLYFLIGAIVEAPWGGPALLRIAAGLALLIGDDWLAQALFGPREVSADSSGDPEGPS